MTNSEGSEKSRDFSLGVPADVTKRVSELSKALTKGASRPTVKMVATLSWWPDKL